MRSTLRTLAVITILGCGMARANGNAPETGTVQDTAQRIQRDTTVGHRAPWETDHAATEPSSTPLKQEKPNTSLYGWLFVGLAAAGMTAYLWRSNRNS